MRHHLRFALIALLLLLLVPARPAGAQFTLGRIGPSNGEIVGVALAIGAVIGVGIYLIARHPRITGCTATGASGLDLRTDAAQPRTYTLLGKTSGLAPDQRIKVAGKRRKTPSGGPAFQVESLKKSYGSCSSATARP